MEFVLLLLLVSIPSNDKIFNHLVANPMDCGFLSKFVSLRTGVKEWNQSRILYPYHLKYYDSYFAFDILSMILDIFVQYMNLVHFCILKFFINV